MRDYICIGLQNFSWETLGIVSTLIGEDIIKVDVK